MARAVVRKKSGARATGKKKPGFMGREGVGLEPEGMYDIGVDNEYRKKAGLPPITVKKTGKKPVKRKG